ncbi:MAG TPA: hypothetical protein PK174_01295 [Anaerolineaceae bacterium]|nr:hypothetical protein [Anaerolineaceae bacterium]
MEKRQIVTTLFLLLIFFAAGFILRFQYIQDPTFPLGDGGLFFSMTNDLIENNFRIPLFTTYNNSQIPYAYSPLAFYLAAGIHILLKIDLLKIFLWMPFLLNLCTIPLVFLFSKQFFKDNSYALITTAIWSISMPAFEWLIMGGGLTRSLAYTASITSLLLLLIHLQTEKKSALLGMILFGGITALSHLEVFLVNCVSILVIWAYMKQKPLKRSIWLLVLYYLGCGLFLLPYILITINNHNFQLFINGFRGGEFSLLPQLFKIILFNYTQEFSINIVGVLALLGIFFQIKKRDYLLVVWFFLILFIDPRSINRSVILILCLLATIAIQQVVKPAFGGGPSNKKSVAADQFENTPRKKRIPLFSVILAFLFLQVFSLVYFQFFVDNLTLYQVKIPARNAYDWINNNTTSDSKFLVLTSSPGWHLDHTAEWFPALAHRTSIATVQGTEWLPVGRYYKARLFNETIKDCMVSDYSCISSLLDKEKISVDYIWVSKEKCENKSKICTLPFLSRIREDSNYQLVFENDGVVIFSSNNY